VLQRAIYVSDAVNGAGSDLQSLAEILGVSDANNRRDRLTGVLLHHDGRFLQAVEGGRVDLDRLIRKLKSDRRHTNLRFLDDGPAPHRRHGDTPMRLLSMTTEGHALLNGADLGAIGLETAEALLIQLDRLDAAA
jgi:hypothetical protein